ncbi:MAG: chemotaxis protein CheA [Alphaproteobacteria bacterium]|nr:chemotaxis protein CheA [Alphaproteobacteria bacterium]
MSDLDRFKETYITECFELLVEMEQLLLALDCDAADMEQLNAIFRCAHSIKGGSGAFGLDDITRFTHSLEALLDAMRDGTVSPTRESVDLLLKSVDVVTRMVQAAKDGVSPPLGLGADIIAGLQCIAGNPTQAQAPQASKEARTEGECTYDITFTPRDTLFSTGNEPLLILRELARLGKAGITAQTDRLPSLNELIPTSCYFAWNIKLNTTKPEADVHEVFEFVTDHCTLSITELKTQAAEKPANTSEESQSKTIQTTSIRVDVEKVDRLVDMVGELVITEAMLRAEIRALSVDQCTGLMRSVDGLSQHTRALQEAVMAVRMQPVKSIFARMPRLVRDLSSQLGKDIRLVTSGENTEVDKTVIEQLSDPLTHMIRNAIDHGIETPQDRAHLGKPAQATIHLSAYHRGGRIIIEISDDGAGIDRCKVLAKAREKGLIPQDATPSDEECDHLIFLPGFSTADTVSNISGRGVGMDVVKRNIESLGGTVRVATQPGKGSVFTVSLPLTLAILDGMIVRVGTEHYIIPITSIIETLRPRAEEVRRVEGRSDVINVRGEFIPIVYLYRSFGVAQAERDASRALVVLVESGSEKMGLVVDELIGQQQVVIKSLEANADPVPGISGATILGDGRVSLILDIDGLKRLLQAPPREAVLAQAA